VHAAVSEKSGTLQLYVADTLNVDHHTYDAGEGRRAVNVPAIAIDDYMKPGERVDVIKMDIQGAEMSALLGARRVLIESSRIELLLEYWPFGLTRAAVEPKQFVRFLVDLGFDIEIIGHGSKRLQEIGSGPGDYCNVHARRRLALRIDEALVVGT